MKLNYEIKDLSGIDEAFKGLYEPYSKEGETVYRLSVEGVKPMSEFDTVYSTMKKERDMKEGFEKSLKAFGDYTPEKIKELETSLAELKAANAKNPSEEYVKQVDALKADHRKELARIEAEWQQKENDYKNQLLEKQKNILSMKMAHELEALYNQKGYPGAFSLALSAAQDALAYDEESQTFRTKDRFSTMSDWLDNIFFKDYPNMLKDNVSGKARESGRASDSRANYFNPASPEYNLTKQGEILRTDKAAYEAFSKMFPKKK